MSLEESLGFAVSQLGQAREEVLGLAEAAQIQITRVGNAYISAINTADVNFWVDQQVGDDGQEGTADAPLKTLQQAVDLAVFSGRVQINLIGNYELTENVNTKGRHIHIRSASDENPSRLTFRRSVENSGGINARQIARFIMSDNGEISFSRITYVVPEIGGFSGTNLTARAHTIAAFSSVRDAFIRVFFSLSTIEIPSNRFGSMIGWQDGLWVGVNGCTFPDQPIQGALLHTNTDTSGTDPLSISRLMTDLSSV